MRTAILLAPLFALVVAASHPTHTSTAELAVRGDSVHLAIRIFADDLAGTGDLRAYVEDHFDIVDAAGATVPLGWRGTRHTGSVVTVRLSGAARDGLRGAVVRHELLMERFVDQVNFVRATVGGRTTTLVFVHGDRPKALP